MTDKFRLSLLHTPEGVWDHYGTDCREYVTVTQSVRDALHSYGYEDIRTPMFEFFDVFSREIGTKPSRELYKFFDKEGNTLVLRPDFTPSIARCAAKYFMYDQNPLRFCYEGRAFSNTSSLQGKRRESTQMGAELINDASVQADAEMIALLIDSLLRVGLTKFQITIGNVEYFRGICEAAGLDEETELSLREHVSGKNYFAAEKLLQSRNVAPACADRFLQITNLASNDVDLEKMRHEAPNEASEAAIERLIEVYHVLKLYGFERYISFDLSLLSKYRYYTGVLYKGYTYGVGERIAAGGRYDSLLSQFGKEAPAIGFTLEIDTLIEALRAQGIPIPVSEVPEALYYTDEDGDYEEKLRQVQQMRKEGRQVVLTRAAQDLT